jgi:predicted nuclease of predicted toxin-antitoxin system
MPSKKSHLQLYADECFPVASVTYLKSLGYSIIHAYDLKFIKKSDRFHLQQSKKLKRVLITLDRDFIFYEQAALINHQGIIVISVGSVTPITVNKICEKFLKTIGNPDLKESLTTVTNDKVTKQKDQKIIYEKTY